MVASVAAYLAGSLAIAFANALTQAFRVEWSRPTPAPRDNPIEKMFAMPPALIAWSEQSVRVALPDVAPETAERLRDHDDASAADVRAREQELDAALASGSPKRMAEARNALVDARVRATGTPERYAVASASHKLALAALRDLELIKLQVLSVDPALHAEIDRRDNEASFRLALA